MTAIPNAHARLDDAQACDARPAPLCDHCGLPVPRGLIEPDTPHQFCCTGCRSVYSILRAGPLAGFYDVKRSLGDRKPTAARPTAHGYGELDDPAYHAANVTSLPDGSRRTTFLLEGVHCAACVWLVERVGRLAPGVIDCRLDFRRSTATLTWDPDSISLAAIARALDRLGYPCHPPRGQRQQDLRRTEDRKFIINLGVAGAIAGNVMLLHFAMYAEMIQNATRQFHGVFTLWSTALGLISLAWPARLFFRGALASLRTRSPSLDVPIAIALLAGGVSGLISAITGHGEVYFDSLTVLVFALLVGRWLQHMQQRRAADSVELLFTTTPTRARLVTGDPLTGPSAHAAIDAVHTGDTVEVLAGETFPVDGAVIHGSSDVDESLITGESRPLRRTTHSRVLAGSTNLSAPLRIRVEATGTDTRVGRLMRLVADAAARKAPLVQLADRLAAWFVVGVATLAVLTAAVWSLIRPEAALERATALLIVTCPCALGLATPLVFTVAIGRLARLSILVKGGDAIERLATPGTLHLDKTGTLTHGRLRVVDWLEPLPTHANSTALSHLRTLVAALERPIAHPVARALAELHPDDGSHNVTDLAHHQGLGVTGTVLGQRLAVGSPRLMNVLGLDIPAELTRWCDQHAARGLSTVLIAHDSTVRAAAAIDDALRPDAAHALDALRSIGWQPSILSGDRADIVHRIADTLALHHDHARGNLTPEDKLAAIHTSRDDAARSAARRGPTVMVGDGVNDAAALAAADVGIAVHGGAEASLEAADVYIAREGLTPLLDLTTVARRAIGRVRLCLAVSLFYNITAGILAIAGLVGPLTAAVIMPASSLTVLAIAAHPGLTRRLRARTTPTHTASTTP